MKSCMAVAILAATLTLSLTAKANVNTAEALENSQAMIVAQSLLGRSPSPNELRAVENAVARVQSAGVENGNRFAQSDEVKSDGPQPAAMQTDVYICAGGKFSVVLWGIQGFKCSSLSGHAITIGFSGEYHQAAETGFAANDYVGVNGGIALDLGVAIFRHPVDTSIRRAYRPEGDSVNGGTINASYFLYGALVGYYRSGESSVSLLSWQPGFAVETSVSQIQVY